MEKKDTINAFNRMAHKVIPFFDRITFWADASIPLNLEKLTNQKINVWHPATITPGSMKCNSSYRYKVCMFQPCTQNLQYLCNVLNKHPVNIMPNRAEIAFDIIPKHEKDLPKLMQTIINYFVFLKQGGQYFEQYDNGDDTKLDPYRSGEPYYYGSHKNNEDNFYPVIYSDRPSKITGEPCCHLEYRIFGKPACIKNNITVISDFLNFNYGSFLSKNALFYIPPTKEQLGLAFAQTKNKKFKNDRGYVRYCNIKLHEYKLSINDPIQKLLAEDNNIKNVLHNKKYKPEIIDFSQSMVNILLNKVIH